MLTITKPQSNRVDLEFAGGIDANIMTKDFELPTFGALGVEFSKLPKLFGLLGKIDKCAVLSDHSWIRTVAEIEGALIPNLKIKSFHLEDQKDAEAWLEG